MRREADEVPQLTERLQVVCSLWTSLSVDALGSLRRGDAAAMSPPSGHHRLRRLGHPRTLPDL
jgi:hypothetical protein